MAKLFELDPVGPYSLAASVRFLEGFAPAAYGGDSADRLRLAFVADGLSNDERIAGVSVRQEDGVVIGEVFGEADVGVVERQVARILSLDVNGSGFPEVGRRDPVVGKLQRRYPGLRPVCFHSPYEAAAWAIIGHRVRIVQAARVKTRMAEELGPKVRVDGKILSAFPGPSRLAGLTGFPGLTETKLERLRHLALAAGKGKLEANLLRPLPVEEALFSATGIARHRAVLGGVDPAPRRRRARPPASTRAAPGTGRREGLRVGRNAGYRRTKGNKRELASVPDVDHPAPAGHVGRGDRRDRREAEDFEKEKAEG